MLTLFIQFQPVLQMSLHYSGHHTGVVQRDIICFHNHNFIMLVLDQSLGTPHCDTVFLHTGLAEKRHSRCEKEIDPNLRANVARAAPADPIWTCKDVAAVVPIQIKARDMFNLSLTVGAVNGVPTMLPIG